MCHCTGIESCKECVAEKTNDEPLLTDYVDVYKTFAERACQTARDPKSNYYDAGGIEVLDIIKAKLTPEQYKGFLLGNCIKYSCRANFKDQYDRDIEKIINYSKWLKEFNVE